MTETQLSSILLSDTGKKEYIIKCFTQICEPCDRSQSFKLILISCYFNIESAKKIIEEIQESINIDSIEIYIDRFTALGGDLAKLSQGAI
jgi:hypothetical protein